MGNRMRLIFGSDGRSHMEFKSGGMSFVDGKTYVSHGNMVQGSDGKTYLKAGNVVIGSDGKTRLAFGDNPTFMR